MSAQPVLLLTLVMAAFCLPRSQAQAQAQPREASQEVSLDREGHAALWALDIPLDAPFRERAGARAGLRLTSWLSGWTELRVAWSQKPSIVRAGVNVWPIGDALKGAYASVGPSFLLQPGSTTKLDAFAELGVRYGWEGLAFTLSGRWDLKERSAVPSFGLMIGYTFGGTE